MSKRPTPAELKAAVEAAGTSPHFFTRTTMHAFGDTMSNYRVFGPVRLARYSGEVVTCWELARQRAVKHNNQQSAYFACGTYERVHGKVLSWFSTSSGLIDLQLTLEDAAIGSHPGPCDADIKNLRTVRYIAEQLAAIKPDQLRKDLREYGAWDVAELADHDENLTRLLWIACGDIVDEAQP